MDNKGKHELAERIRSCGEEMSQVSKAVGSFFSEVISILEESVRAEYKITKGIINIIIHEEKEDAWSWIANLLQFESDQAQQWITRCGEMQSSNPVILCSENETKREKKVNIEVSKNSEKKLAKQLEIYQKATGKYDKQLSEFNKLYGEYQKLNQSGYNVTLSTKTESKLKALIAEITTSEEETRKAINYLNQCEGNLTIVNKQTLDTLDKMIERNLKEILLLLKIFISMVGKVNEVISGQSNAIYLPQLTEAKNTQSNIEGNIHRALVKFETSLPWLLPEDYEKAKQDGTEQNSRTEIYQFASNSIVQSESTILQNTPQQQQQTLIQFQQMNDATKSEPSRLLLENAAKVAYERMKKVLDDHQKNSKTIANYFSELSEVRDSFIKRTLKLMASKLQSPPVNSPNVIIQGFMSDILSTLQGFIEGLVETWKTKAADANNKAAALTAIVGDYQKADKTVLQVIQNRVLRLANQNSNGNPFTVTHISEQAIGIQRLFSQLHILDITSSRMLFGLIHGSFQTISKQSEGLARKIQQISENFDRVEKLSLQNVKVYFEKEAKILEKHEQEPNIIVFVTRFSMPDDLKSDYIQGQQQKNRDELSEISSSLQDTSQQEDSLKISSSLARKFNLPSSDFLVDTYKCSFSASISLAGKVYIFNTMLAFNSKFNAKTLLGELWMLLFFAKKS